MTYSLPDRLAKAATSRPASGTEIVDGLGRTWRLNQFDGTYATLDDEETGWSLSAIRRLWGESNQWANFPRLPAGTVEAGAR